MLINTEKCVGAIDDRSKCEKDIISINISG